MLHFEMPLAVTWNNYFRNKRFSLQALSAITDVSYVSFVRHGAVSITDTFSRKHLNRSYFIPFFEKISPSIDRINRDSWTR